VNEGTAKDPRPAAVSFVTTEHFVLQGSRAWTISEATGRASMFLTAVSGGLVALGLVATASGIGSAFYAFALILLPTLAFVGLVTFERALQSGVEDYGYAKRIALLRGFYFDNAPEITPYLLTVPETQRVRVQGLGGGRWQGLITVAGMVGVIACVLCGSTIGLAVAVGFDHELTLSLVAGGVAALVALAALMRFQRGAWIRAETRPVSFEEIDG
jgi:hypothetical protein